jgi:hypothetical protein
MDYELRGFKVFDAPEVDVPEDGKTTLRISCTTGIVGDTYSFEKVDEFDMVVDNNKTIDQIMTEIEAKFEFYINTTYPNT